MTTQELIEACRERQLQQLFGTDTVPDPLWCHVADRLEELAGVPALLVAALHVLQRNGIAL
jgi:hypothetical protein